MQREAQIIPFPQHCTQETCHQGERIARLETQGDNTATQLDRIESTLEHLRWNLLGVALAAAGAAISTAVSVVFRSFHP